MATQKVQTLAIKDFRGVNRFNDGTVTPPNEFYAIQNMHPVNRGELAAIGGVEDLNTVAMPGVQEIVHTAWLDQSFGDKKLVAFFRPSIAEMPEPSVTSSNFSTSGGSGVNYDITITYVGPGGATYYKVISTYSVELNGFVFTPPNDVPDYVAAIDIHAQLSATTGTAAYAWCGTMSRRAGAFAASITCQRPVFAVTTATVIDAAPNGFTATGGVSTGSLTAGRQYYFAIAPWVCQTKWKQSDGGRHTRAYLAYSTTNFFSCTLPTLFTSINIKFTFSASPAVTAGTNVTHWVLFMGTTPEDMLAVSTTSNGTILPIADADIRAGVDILEIPYNSRNTVHMISSGDMDQGGTGLDAAAGRDYGIFKNMMLADGASADFAEGGGDIRFSVNLTASKLPYLGAWVIPALPFSLSTAYQLLPHINERNFVSAINSSYAPYASAKTPTPSPIVFYDPANFTGSTVESEQYADRLYCANNSNVMFYTNGYSLKTVVRDAGAQYVPICKYIGLVQDQIVLGGGDESFANTKNQVFYADTLNPNSFGVASWNTFSVNSGDGSFINGFGLYSQNLSTVGGKTFLLISKGGGVNGNLFSWNGAVGTDLVVTQIEKIGFAGPRAFAQTRFGPIFIARSGAYLVTGAQSVTPIGDEIQDIMQALSEASLALVNCTYHQNRVKVGYTSSSGLDRELWLELRREGDGIQKFWSGPHVLKAFNDQCSTGFFNASPDYRVSCFGAKLYRRDSTELNDGSNIARSITIRNLGLSADHFKKLLEWVFLSVKVQQNETFNFSFAQENGTGTTAGSVSVVYSASTNRQLAQFKLSERITGRIETLTITNTSSKLLSLYDISLLFKIQRRRLLA